MTVNSAIALRIPAGWYPDRLDRTRRRWWDGTEWTDYYSAVPQPHLRLVEGPADVAGFDLIEEDTETRRAVHTLTRALTFSDRVPAFVLVGLFTCNVVAVVILAVID
jgi:hypothetical protein